MSNVKIYKDINANAIFIEDSNGVQFLNSLQSSVNGSKIDIIDLSKNIQIVSGIDFNEFVDENDVTYEQISINNGGTGTSIEVSNLLNSVFQSSGTPTNQTPTITSSLSISLVQGQTLNYELTASFGVGYEWDLSNVAGVTTVEGNVRKIIGGSSLSAGVYSIPVKAINYNGEDAKTIVLTVGNPVFANTRSVQFNNNQYLLGNGGVLQGVLGRSGNGSGSSDAWTISFYFKPGTSNNANQTILYAGSSNLANNNHLRVYWNGNNSTRRQLCLRYGSNNNNLEIKSQVNTVQSANNWQHCLVSYDGGTTGSASGQINNYYSRFKIFIDGVQQTTVNANSNFGNSTPLNTTEFQIAKYSIGGNYLRNNSNLDEIAIWGSDESSQISNIYNSGVPINLNTLINQPIHWWRMGDGDTFPFLQDIGTASNCILTMQSMTSSNIVNDAP